MAKRGRKMKPGRREPNGRLQREPRYDKGSEWAQRRRKRFGVHYTSALGRAYAAGLLGSPDEALNRYQAANMFTRVYTRVVGSSHYRCPLDDTPHSSAPTLGDPDRDEKDHDWLLAAMRSLDGAGLRPWFDQLISILYTDTGPPWLDRILADKGNQADRMILKAAIDGLDIIAPAIRPMGIQVWHG